MVTGSAAPAATMKQHNRGVAKVVVTGPGTYTGRRPRSVLRKSLPGAQVARTAFPSVFVVEKEGDVMQVAEEIAQKCLKSIGHVTAVLGEVESKLEPIKEAAVKIATDHVEKDEKFCFRLHKRGSHSLVEDTCTIESQIGDAIWEALKLKHHAEPVVDLSEPDVTVIAEVLGSQTAIGISKRDWRLSRKDAAQ